jgi:hypothetical protein
MIKWVSIRPLINNLCDVYALKLSFQFLDYVLALEYEENIHIANVKNKGIGNDTRIPTKFFL